MDCAFESFYESKHGKTGNIADRIKFESDELYEVKKEVETETDEISTASEVGHEEECLPIIKWRSEYDSKVYSTCQVKVRDARDYLFCSYCNEWSLTTAALKLHKQTHYKNEKDKNTPEKHLHVKHGDSKNIKTTFCDCDLCHKSFTRRKKKQDTHALSHKSRPVPYEIYDKRYKTEDFVANEMKHEGTKPYASKQCDLKTYVTHSCELCNRTFSSQLNLLDHLKKLHIATKRVENDDKIFGNQHTLLLHNETVNLNQKPFICDFCGMSYGLKQSLIQHMLVHTTEEPFLCDVCNRSFKSSQAVGSHKKTHHAVMQKFRCEHCEREFNLKFKLERHILNECQTNFKNKPKTQTESKVKTQTIKSSNGGILIKKKRGYRKDQGTFYCDMCDKKFTRNWSLNLHKLVHDKCPFSCEICGKMFKNEKACATHELKHVGIKPHQCDRCNKSFATKDNLKDHLNSHTGDKPYACKACGSRFKYDSNLRAHNRMFHNTFKDFKPQIFSCDQCDKTFPFKRYLLKHQDRKHSEVRRFACEECPKRFLMKHELEDHILCIHTDFKAFECEQCSKRFATKYRLAKHERCHTGEAYKYPCDVCGKKFLSKKYQIAHTLRHQGIRNKQFACVTCGRAFEDPNTLKRHQVIHSDIRPYSCDECGKSFKLKQSVHSHKLSHTQIRPFPCEVCGERYKTIGQKNQHMKKHEEIKCFYWCDYCGRQFSYKTSVQRHIFGYCAKSGYNGNKKKSKKL